jgi:hypothetical protein
MEWTHSQRCINIRANRANQLPIARDYLQECLQLVERAFSRIKANRTFTTRTFWINRISIIRIKFKISILKELNLRVKIYKVRQIGSIRAVRRSTDKTHKSRVWRPSPVILASTRIRTPTLWSKSSREQSKLDSLKINLSTRSTFLNNWTAMRSTTNSCRSLKRGRLSTVKWRKSRHLVAIRHLS